MPLCLQLYDIETLGSLKAILMLADNPPVAVLVNRAPMYGKHHIETQEAEGARIRRLPDHCLWVVCAWRCREWRQSRCRV
jgi:hypothetical protein